MNRKNSTADVEDPDTYSKELQEFYDDHAVVVNIVNRDGIVVISSDEDDIGYDMHDNEYTAEFLKLLDGRTLEYTQDVRADSTDTDVLMKYAGKRLPDGSGFIEVGVTNRQYYHDLREQASISVTNRRIDEKGYVLVASEKQRILNSYQNLYVGKSLFPAFEKAYRKKHGKGKQFAQPDNGRKS